MKKDIYLDSAATTRVYPEVVEVMKKAMLEDYGNPSSLHLLGEKAFEGINLARRKLADEIGAKAHEIVFTSGGTEANNLALSGVLRANSSKKKKIFISAIEHPSVSETARHLKRLGYGVVEIPVDKTGRIDFEFLEKMIDKRTALVSVMHVNNVFGTIQDVEKIGKLCKDRGVLFHTDAVQSFGKLKIDVKKMGIDLLSASGHKIGGPKGVGFLYVCEDVKLEPVIYGGGQEKGLRSGTENVPGIVGFAKALEIYKNKNWERVEKARDLMIAGLNQIGGQIHGVLGSDRIYDNIYLSFKDVSGESLVYHLSSERIYVSSGSACDSKKSGSEVLKAIGLSRDEIKSGIRISLGNDIDERDIKIVLTKLEKILKKLKR